MAATRVVYTSLTSRFSFSTIRILGAALLLGAVALTPTHAEAARRPVVVNPIIAAEDMPAAILDISATPASAAGVIASTSMQSAALIATGPSSVTAAFQAPQASSPFALLRKPMLAALDAQVRLLACTIFAEARSEGGRGMRAVAHVIQNRVGPRFGPSLSDVIFAPWQFSAWNRGDPNRAVALNPERYARSAGDRAAWDAAQSIAREVMEGRSVDPTNGALFYHTRAVKPRWSSAGVGKRIIGQHIFYRDVRG